MVMDIDDNINTELERDDSTESYNFDALVEDVQGLYFQENIPTRPQATDLIQKLILDFSEYDTSFLKEYLNVLQNSNNSDIRDVTNNIVYSIEEVLKQHLKSDRQWQEPVLVVLLGWMCVTVLCLVDPHVQSPYRALSELLLYTTMKERVRLAKVFWRQLSPCHLIELADVTTGPEPILRSEDPMAPEASLADLLLRGALSALQPDLHEPQWQDGPLKVEEVAAGLTSAWAGATSQNRTQLAKVAARTHAVRALVSIAEAAHAAGKPETLKVLVAMSKLRLLFLDDEKINEHITKKRKKHKRRKNK